jgi:hypothetical protein
VYPPSTMITCPVTQDARSVQRNAATFATSSGLPTRLNGVRRVDSLMISS